MSQEEEGYLLKCKECPVRRLLLGYPGAPKSLWEDGWRMVRTRGGGYHLCPRCARLRAERLERRAERRRGGRSWEG